MRRRAGCGGAPRAPRASRRGCRCSFRRSAAPCRPAQRSAGARRGRDRREAFQRVGAAFGRHVPVRNCAAASAASAFIAMWRPGALRRKAMRDRRPRRRIAAIGVLREIDQPDVRGRRRAEDQDVRAPAARAAAAAALCQRAAPRRRRAPVRAGFRPSRRRSPRRAEEADMRLLDRGDHRDMRPRELRQGGDLAGVVHADLDDAEPAYQRHARQSQRHAPVVVEGARGSVRRTLPGVRSISLCRSCRRCR